MRRSTQSHVIQQQPARRSDIRRDTAVLLEHLLATGAISGIAVCSFNPAQAAEAELEAASERARSTRCPAVR